MVKKVYGKLMAMQLKEIEVAKENVSFKLPKILN